MLLEEDSSEHSREGGGSQNSNPPQNNSLSAEEEEDSEEIPQVTTLRSWVGGSLMEEWLVLLSHSKMVLSLILGLLRPFLCS